MRLWVFSDLHLEMTSSNEVFDIPAADVCVCAGDILDRGPAASVNWLAENIVSHMPVVFVAGNHEFYRSDILGGMEKARRVSQQYANLHFLADESVEIAGVRFVGSTLWTDFNLLGDREMTMLRANIAMNDFRQIKLQTKPYRRFHPLNALRMHQGSRSFIAQQLREMMGPPTVVITHHAPSALSIPSFYNGDFSSSCFASELTDLVLVGQPKIWIHGHVHERCDYFIGDTRVLANPRGYPGERGISGFDPKLVVEV